MPTEPTSAALRPEAGPAAAATGGRTARDGARIRHQLRDATAAAAVSLTGSVLVVVALWAVAAWLG